MKSVAYKITLLTPVLLLLQLVATAQNVVFTATTSAQRVSLDDQFEVVYTIHNASNLVKMGADQLRKDFNIVAGPFSSENNTFSSVNGRTTVSQSFSVTYVVQPKRTGVLTVPAAVAVDASRHTYQSNTLNITVGRGGNPQNVRSTRGMNAGTQSLPQQQSVDLSNEVFIRAEVEKKSAHVGEQVNINWKLYTRVPLQMTMFHLPSISGVYSHGFDSMNQNHQPEAERVDVINGRQYRVYTLKKQAVFPQQAGKLTIEPAVLQGSVPLKVQSRRDPFEDMFDDPFLNQALGRVSLGDPFGFEEVPVALKSQPITLDVQPLSTAGQPADFTGAVGRFTLQSSLDKKSLTTDDVASLTLQIDGSGNFKLFTAPKLALPDGLTSYEPTYLDSITSGVDPITGRKTITYNIAPKVAGDYTIPPQSFSYFNPQTGQYEVKHTPSYTIHVRPGSGSEHSNRQSTLADIHEIDTVPAVATLSSPIILSTAYWSAYSMPVLLLLGLIAYRRKKDQDSLDTPELRQDRANGLAIRQLTDAQKLLHQGNPRAFYEAVSKAVWLYLSYKLNIPFAQLSKEAALSALATHSVSDDLQHELVLLLDECELALYAPGGGIHQMDEMYKAAVSLISQLEAAFVK